MPSSEFLEAPNAAEDKETRIRQDIQDRYPGDDVAERNRYLGEAALRGSLAIPHQEFGRLPVDDQAIADRTTDNRVNLADDVPAVDLKPTYGGYLDVVMHGDASGTEARVHGEVTEFSLEQTAQLVERTPGWDHRPVRLLSCSTGQETYAQELANRLDVPVYAPTDVLDVNPDGTTEIENGGSWRRFEPEPR